MEYRKATLQDLEELVSLRIEMRNERESPEGIDGQQFYHNTSEYFTRHMGDESYVSWVAVSNRRIVAMSGICFYEVPPIYSNMSGKTAYIMNVYTKPQYRRQGIAQALMNHILQEAEYRGCTELTLNASETGRPLYEKLGFTADGHAMRVHLRALTD